MTAIINAIQDVAFGRVERIAYPARFRVWKEGNMVMYENLADKSTPVVVCTVVEEVE